MLQGSRESKKLFLSFVLFLTFTLTGRLSYSEEVPNKEPASPEVSSPKTNSPKTNSDEGSTHQGSLLVHYSPFDLILPSKIGAAIGWRTTETTAWEFEYTSGSIPLLIKDIGKLSETRYTLWRRLGKEEGFQWYYGVFYHKFQVLIGDELLSRLTGGYYPSVDLLAIEGFGPAFGLGYRWIASERILIGLDAFAWSQPLITTKKQAAFLDAATNQNDRDNVDTALKIMQYFPRLTALKFSVGFNF